MANTTRPRPLARIVVDAENAYARAEISPTAATPEIRSKLQAKHTDLTSKAKRAGGDPQLTRQIEQVGKLLDEIGDPKKRAEYDAKHPENELLTVQPPSHDAIPTPVWRAAFATAWLMEEAGSSALLPHPESLALWSPAGISEELLRFLEPYQEAQRESPDVTSRAVAPERAAAISTGTVK